MICAGTRGTSAEQMRQTLHFVQDDDTLYSSFRDLTGILTQSDNPSLRFAMHFTCQPYKFQRIRSRSHCGEPRVALTDQPQSLKMHDIVSIRTWDRLGSPP